MQLASLTHFLASTKHSRVLPIIGVFVLLIVLPAWGSYFASHQTQPEPITKHITITTGDKEVGAVTIIRITPTSIQ